jgi:hypothetical protein
MKYLKLSARLLFGFVAVVILLLFAPYLAAPVYDFPENKAFSGDILYNPYQETDSNFWRKSNFQVQSRIWGGITNGRNNTNEMIDSTYRWLDYDVIGTSDYMQINDFYKGQDRYIPIYEHGYSIFKRHQIVMGAESINWLDYFYFQTLSQKQHVINKLEKESDLIILAHPCLRGSYDATDFTKLSGYDGIEVLNYFCTSVGCWDSALSSGHYVVAIGNDDVHDITNNDEVGQYITYINSKSLHGDSVIAAIKKHKSYAYTVFRWPGDGWELRREKHDNIAHLQQAVLSGDTFRVRVDKKSLHIIFYGQGGELLQTNDKCDQAEYVFRGQNNYIRAEIHFPNRDVMYLNPVVRTPNGSPEKAATAVFNFWMTWVYRIVAIIIYLLAVFVLLKIWKKTRIKA